MEAIQSIVLRVMFASAFLLLALGVVERLVNEYGYTIMRGSLSGGRLFEIASVIVLFVVAILLRQIRDQARAGAR